MKSLRRQRREKLLLPVALGLSDGILNALILASPTVIHGHGISAALAAGVGVVAFVSTVFTIFVADYAQLRGRREAAASADAAAVSSLGGSVFPLLIGGALSGLRWAGLLVALAALGGLGAVLATAVGGRRAYGAAALPFGGSGVAVIGSRLRLT